MPMEDFHIILNRDAARSDLSLFLTHLTRGKDFDDAYLTLWKILSDMKLKSRILVPETDAVVCFQDLPLRAIVENLRYEMTLIKERKRNDKNYIPKFRYTPFGLRIDKRYAFSQGARPVVYETNNNYKKVLAKDNYWRYVSMDYESKGAYIDWTHEREWRNKGDFSLEYKQLSILLPTPSYYRRFIKDCESKKD